MKRPTIRPLLSVILALALSACSSQKPEPAETAAAEAPAAETTAAVTEKLAQESTEDMSSTPDVPFISEDFSDGSTAAVKRGSASLEIADDDKASDGKALFISGRKEAWNGADYKSDIYRGNEVEVKGSFRSANKAVRVSIQMSVQGNTTYNMVFSVNTNGDSYSSGSGKYTIPPTANNIIIYIESDELNDIYCDSFSINVNGDYTYYEKALETVLADTSDYPSLKEAYSDRFLIGMAVSPTILAKPAYNGLIKAQFNSITAENDMKPEAILDRSKCVSDPDTYREAPAQNFEHLRTELNFAKENGMTVRGHTLVWHSQTPEWLFYADYDKKGELADRELMLRRMENYIKGIMEWTAENYPGLISAWDVVNEAAADEGGMRQSLWYRTVGEDYIEKAFEYARKYAPEGAKLFYNDYNSYQKKKQDDILSFLKPIAEAGNIDGVGMQSHVGTYMNINEYANALQRYHDELGVEIQITELDISADRSDDWEEKQGKYFGDFMSKVIELRDSGVPITSVTLWGISDTLSWKASDRPLVFRDDLSRKPAFDAMIEAAKK
jgi:endo-1,4-beta-xylanase